MRAEHHPDQADRLQTLYTYDILDTPRERSFDEIVELTAQICDAPISVINLIDQDRQWFKAEVGLNARSTPIDTSICAHVILGEDFTEIEDTLQDPRMSDNPLCLGDPGLRFYAGARLLAADGLPLGTLCVLDYKPRKLTALQRNTIQVLARQVMHQLELRMALKNVEVLRAEADHRVKNSLQTLASMVRLHSRTLKEETAREALDAVSRRLGSISALHRELQDAPLGGKICICSYLERITEVLRDTLPPHVHLVCDADEMLVSSHSATALAMIVSEFAANSVKHAFPDGRTGEVSVSVGRNGNSVVLECRDNGIGGGAACSDVSGAATSLGSSLMDAAAAQLRGEISTRLTPEGCILQLRFPAG
ncbi:sensor histidine kinase [Cribrihabitans neustonicus]|uniref:sensor histidine kinase n=1 Tax=Cribrihabitans neustonicus TaxID=1429085 RepID=UPI003B5A7DE3